MIHLVKVIIILFIVVNINADEMDIPDFEGKSKKYLNKHEVGYIIPNSENEYQAEMSADELIVGDITDKDLKYWLFVIGINGHQCNMAGSAKKISEGIFEFKDKDCKLTFTILEKSIKIDDKYTCTRDYCGKRAGIGKIEFK